MTKSKQYPLSIIRETAIGKRSSNELRLGLVQVPVALDGTNGNKICRCLPLTIHTIEMTKLEVNRSDCITSNVLLNCSVR